MDASHFPRFHPDPAGLPSLCLRSDVQDQPGGVNVSVLVWVPVIYAKAYCFLYSDFVGFLTQSDAYVIKGAEQVHVLQNVYREKAVKPFRDNVA